MTDESECDCPQGICVAWVDRAICREEHIDEASRQYLRSMSKSDCVCPCHHGVDTPVFCCQDT